MPGSVNYGWIEIELRDIEMRGGGKGERSQSGTSDPNSLEEHKGSQGARMPVCTVFALEKGF